MDGGAGDQVGLDGGGGGGGDGGGGGGGGDDDDDCWVALAFERREGAGFILFDGSTIRFISVFLCLCVALRCQSVPWT